MKKRVEIVVDTKLMPRGFLPKEFIEAFPEWHPVKTESKFFEMWYCEVEGALTKAQINLLYGELQISESIAALCYEE